MTSVREHITGFSNPTVKYLRSLRDKKHRKREARFLAEGLRLIEDACASGRVPEILVMAEGRAAHPLLDSIAAQTAAQGGRIIETSPAILEKISGKANPQTVLGMFAEWPAPLASLDRSSAPIWMVAQELRDPGNLGTMMRTCDAVGAGGLILIDDCADPFSLEAVRASMGAIFTVPIARARWQEFALWLRDDRAPGPPAQLVAASLVHEALPYREAVYQAPCFLLMGNESQGLPQDFEQACDLRVRMPMLGRADSLNAAVAGAVLAYEALAQLGVHE